MSFRLPDLLSETPNVNSHSLAAQGLKLRSVAATPVHPEMVAVYPLGGLPRSCSVNCNNYTSGKVSCPASNYRPCNSVCRNDFVCQDERKNLFSVNGMAFASIARGTGSETKNGIKGSKKTVKTSDSANSSNPTYTLKSFLKDFQKRESDGDLIADLDFSDQHALSWNTGTNMSGMLRGDISDGAAYQCKFEKWAKGVVAREKKRLYDEAFVNQEFASSIWIQSMRNSWPARSKSPVITEVQNFP